MAGENYARQEDMDAILAMNSIAVVGLSSEPFRPSYGVARYMQHAGYDIFPVNPNEVEVLGKPAFASLRELPVPPDVVDVFRRPEFVDAVVDDAIASGAKALWLQQGVVNVAAARRAREAGLLVVMDRCIMVEHANRDR